VGRHGLILTALILGGCHLIFPFEAQMDPDGPAPMDADGGAPADRFLGDGDAPISVVLTITAPDPAEVRVGQHVPVELTLSGHEGNVNVQVAASGGCLLAVPGKKRAVEGYWVGQLSPGKLVAHLFAPPAVKPGATCSVGFSLAGAGEEPSVSFAVTDPVFELLFLQSGAIQGMKGLKVTEIGALEHPGAIQGVVHAGGSFGGDFVVGTGTRSSSNLVKPSTVRVYRFKGDLSSAGTIQPALDLFGLDKNPTALDGLAWSDRGPCTPDAIYLAANYGDYTYAPDTTEGSITCMDSNSTLTQIINDNARAVSVVPTAGFFSNNAAGSVIYSSDGATYLYPGNDTVDVIGDGTNQMVFAPAGLNKGHLYLIKAATSYPLLRISPPPQKVTTLRELNDTDIRFTLSPGGIFGPMVVTGERGVQPDHYHLLGLVEEGGSVREVTLLQEVPCGHHFAMSSQGNYLVLPAGQATAKGCTGSWSIYRLEFDLP
jgi:hypothetical protein